MCRIGGGGPQFLERNRVVSAATCVAAAVAVVGHVAATAALASAAAALAYAATLVASATLASATLASATLASATLVSATLASATLASATLASATLASATLASATLASAVAAAALASAVAAAALASAVAAATLASAVASATLASASAVAAATAAVGGSIAAAAEELDLVADHLRAPAVPTVAVLPLAGLESTFHVDLSPLVEEASGVLRVASEEHDAVPFGLVLPVPVPVLAAVGRGDAEVADGRAAASGADLWVLSEVSDEDDLVDHDVSFCRARRNVCSAPDRKCPGDQIPTSSALLSQRARASRGSRACFVGAVILQSTKYSPVTPWTSGEEASQIWVSAP